MIPPPFAWSRLPRPFFVLAPMEDVTDTVYRRLIRRWSERHGAPGPAVMFTEFTRVDGAIRAWETPIRTRSAAGRLGYFTAEERPLVAQLWGTRPEEFHRAAEAVAALGFDGIDINMGCPARKIRKAGACSALIARPELAAELIAACRAGSTLPVSVKTRVGLDRDVTDEWIGFLLSQNLDAITVHGRIADEMSDRPADWNAVARSVVLRDALSATGADGTPTRIIGNGDVTSLAHGEALARSTGADGIMIGRGIFADPLLFARTPTPWPEMPLATRLSYLREQIIAFTDHWGAARNYEILKKFFRTYVTVPDGPPEELALLEELYATHAVADALALIDQVVSGDRSARDGTTDSGGSSVTGAGRAGSV
ncbi:MAG: tRNA-dihydrouridine synthase family protein [Spirochaeta sp.]|nr:tRNA-dihydrouridine synthase family protein [Spirochaeta sp.]